MEKMPEAKKNRPQAVTKMEESKQNQSRQAKPKIGEHKRTGSLQQQKAAKPLWDCGSTLYDSFELNSFKRQLDSAISRTLSMSHLSDRRIPPPLPPPPSTEAKKSSKISRSLNKLLKSVFKSKRSSGSVFVERSHHEYYFIYDKSGALTTIPEVPEIDLGGFSPEINSIVRRTASERFTPASMIGISCA